MKTKKYKTIYCDEYIEFWPYHDAGIIHIWMNAVLVLTGVIVSVLDWINKDFDFFYPIAIVTILLFFISILLSRGIYKKIVVSHTAIKVYDKEKLINEYTWDDFEAIYTTNSEIQFATRVTYRAFLKSKKHKKMSYSTSCDFVLPLVHVNGKEVMHEFIPKELIRY